MSIEQQARREADKEADKRFNRGMMLRLAVIVAVMFGFGYALVPLYKKICEITGINVITTRELHGAVKNTQIDKSRTITVEFDSNARGPFAFRPVKNSMEVHPGEMATIVYEVANGQPRDISAQAIPSYAPKQATQYFMKLECFCFKQQTLKAQEAREMPVVFVIDPALPKDVKNITLSYTFFEVGTPVAQAPEGQLAPQPAPAGKGI
ncbi:cytochrome c oxidase assembly protein [Cupriavidus taiwanensis]|uniref:Cytochrome c oxidase assembly protein CtaG n=1 Tax=Cupriavidus taiwanensis TaxID=164546 RepID=A0A375BPY3_9BURK|nr:cytochrome c oxidase assembly protein [Cupriavidus taiwanensis]MDK3025617.1 cytochrome c oxidase assembly protein [Cupriavidus taiwanensis]NSX17184.1 cytochrome c oxidase assembly protein [Cupriavidus taiwanensis]SOY50052.1 Cytochrome c oxidase assembly protein CtaG/Cox11; transmembrane protein [Cupriavidus taiwanensis]